jgi:hypothetical protein
MEKRLQNIGKRSEKEVISDATTRRVELVIPTLQRPREDKRLPWNGRPLKKETGRRRGRRINNR